MEVVKELGLITCGRSVFCQGARLFGWRRRRDDCLGVVHMEGGVQVRVQVGGGETHGKEQSEEQRSNEKQSTAHHGWHEYEVRRACRHLSHVV